MCPESGAGVARPLLVLCTAGMLKLLEKALGSAGYNEETGAGVGKWVLAVETGSEFAAGASRTEVE